MKWISINEKIKLTASMLVSRLINSFRNPSLLTYKEILCIKDDEIGDMCYSLHVFPMLRRQYPGSRITVLCKPYSAPLIQNDLSITRIITSWNDATDKYDLLIDLRVSWRSIRKALVTWPKARLDRGTVRFTDAFQKLYPHETETNLKVVAPVIRTANQIRIPVLKISDKDKDTASEYILKHGLKSVALLHISARRELRKWPLDRYVALAEFLHKEKNMDIVFIGSPDEKEDISKAIERLSFPAQSTAGILNLTQLAALMQRSALFVGNESGPLHIAAVSGLPCIGLYGPGPQTIFYPIGKKSAYIHHVLECNPCGQITCVHPELPCMQRISLDEVIAKVQELTLQEA